MNRRLIALLVGVVFTLLGSADLLAKTIWEGTEQSPVLNLVFDDTPLPPTGDPFRPGTEIVIVKHLPDTGAARKSMKA